MKLSRSFAMMALFSCVKSLMLDRLFWRIARRNFPANNCSLGDNLLSDSMVFVVVIFSCLYGLGAEGLDRLICCKSTRFGLKKPFRGIILGGKFLPVWSRWDKASNVLGLKAYKNFENAARCLFLPSRVYSMPFSSVFFRMDSKSSSACGGVKVPCWVYSTFLMVSQLV